MSTKHRLSAQAAVLALSQGAVLIDVRPEASRLRDGAVAGALVIGKTRIVDALSPNSRQRLPRQPGQAAILFCTTEGGSAPYIAALLGLGVADLYDVDGGFQALSRQREVAVLPADQGQGTSIKPAKEA